MNKKLLKDANTGAGERSGSESGRFRMQLWRALVVLGLAAMARAQGDRVDFVREIQPLFREKCYRCHGPGSQMAQLRLDSKELALRGGISGQVLVPGNAHESILLQRISGAGAKARMPLQGQPLTPQQVESVRRWIDQGSTWPDYATVSGAKITQHWAFPFLVTPTGSGQKPLLDKSDFT